MSIIWSTCARMRPAAARGPPRWLLPRLSPLHPHMLPTLPEEQVGAPGLAGGEGPGGGGGGSGYGAGWVCSLPVSILQRAT